MVAQPARFTTVRHLSRELFEVTVINGACAEVYHTQPAVGRCTCATPYCAHLADTNAFLDDHRCPYCRNYSPFGALCHPCYSDIEAGMFTDTEEVA